MRSLRTLAVLLAIVAGACAGPQDPFEVGVREFPTDVLIGTPNTSDTVPVAVDPGLPIVIRRTVANTPEPLPQSPAVTPSPPCPEAHPFDAPKIEAPNRATAPPVDGAHTYRTKGSIELDGTKFPLPPTTVREIANVQTTPDGFTYDVVAGQVTTSWQVVSEGDGGIYMTKQVSVTPQGESRFEPTPAIRFLPFPAQPGLTWDSVGIDLESGTTMALSGRVGVDKPDPDDPEATVLEPKVGVDACGEVIDAWLVEIRGPQRQGNAQIVSPTQTLELQGTYAFATQFGGLSVADVVTVEGTTVAGELKSVEDSVINAVPEQPEQP